MEEPQREENTAGPWQRELQIVPAGSGRQPKTPFPGGRHCSVSWQAAKWAEQALRRLDATNWARKCPPVPEDGRVRHAPGDRTQTQAEPEARAARAAALGQALGWNSASHSCQ